MKRVIIILSALVLLTGIEAVSSAQQGPVVGSYQERPKDDPEVVAAARFAVGEEGRREGAPVSLVAINRAERQVVAGFNYRLRLSVKSKGEIRDVSAVVYQNLKSEYSLSSWERSGGEGTAPATREAAEERRAVKGAIRRELSRATPAHVKVSQFTINSLDVQSGWALAGVEPSGDTPLDPVSVLLRKQRGRWKVLTLGTSLHGTGRSFHVPRGLWRKWGLD
jgi:hypothetical protein